MFPLLFPTFGIYVDLYERVAGTGISRMLLFRIHEHCHRMTVTIADMPSEIIRHILKYGSVETQLAFISCCKPLFRAHSLDFALARLQSAACKKSPVLLALSPSKMLVRRRIKYQVYPRAAPNNQNDSADDATDRVMVRGSSVYKSKIYEDWVLEPCDYPAHKLARPFVVLTAEYSPARDDIILQVAFPEYRASNDNALEVYPNGSRVSLKGNFKIKARQLRDRLLEGGTMDSDECYAFSYNMALRTGCFFEHIKSSNALRRWWMYECWECGRFRTICPGCGGVSRRWPDVFTSCGYFVPCPRCVGYIAAQDAKYLVYDDDQRAIDENFNVAPVKVRTWSKEEWDTMSLLVELPLSLL